ncbi:MAG TPA: ParB/RepB/Spo0J family partition protein [Caulobacteraceae bacterium]|nr:ParB/RepB/Spo0J family partition protein [Caulobacteraceae bacterium]
MAAEGRRGLGRGLSALLGEQADAVSEDQAASRAGPGAVASEGAAFMVPIELLHPNPAQPRKTFGETELEELSRSLRTKGVIQPLLVRPSPRAAGDYEIVAGERRWRAAQRAGLRELPVVVRRLDDSEVLQIAIIENVQRADLNPVEEALAYRALIDQYGHTQDEVAEVVGKSRPHVANTLRLLGLPAEVQEHLLHGRLTAGHARALATAADPAALARQVIEGGLSVRAAEALGRQAAGGDGRPRPAPPPAPVKDADTAALENDLAELIGLDVSILDKGGAGEVRVRYTTLEQLDDICRRLSRS